VIVVPQERASQYLAYQTADTVDCKGLFVLDKLHGRPRAEILEQARVSLTSALHSGRCVFFATAHCAFLSRITEMPDHSVNTRMNKYRMS
jgi:hypothetical protein